MIDINGGLEAGQKKTQAIDGGAIKFIRIQRGFRVTIFGRDT